MFALTFRNFDNTDEAACYEITHQGRTLPVRFFKGIQPFVLNIQPDNVAAPLLRSPHLLGYPDKAAVTGTFYVPHGWKHCTITAIHFETAIFLVCEESGTPPSSLHQSIALAAKNGGMKKAPTTLILSLTVNREHYAPALMEPAKADA